MFHGKHDFSGSKQSTRQSISQSDAEEAGEELAGHVGEAGEVVTGEEELERFIHEGRKGGESSKEAGDQQGRCGGGGTEFRKENTEKSNHQGTQSVDEPGAVRKSGAQGAGNQNGHAISAKTTETATEGDEKRKGVMRHSELLIKAVRSEKLEVRNGGGGAIKLGSAAFFMPSPVGNVVKLRI